MKGKFDAYVLWPLAQRVQNWIVDQSTARDFTVIVNFITKKLKSKHTSLKKYTNWAKLVYFFLFLREQEELKPKYFAP